MHGIRCIQIWKAKKTSITIPERRLSISSNRSQDFTNGHEDVETWMSCDAEDCGFQMLNDDEILISVQEESDTIDDETDEDNNHSSNDP
ncbi:hypothetical protein TNCV_4481161 [Trichonephila clavipes]|nr:hypothetical protein TNCV_4481161 [Trichonephila clavipes]